MTKTQYSGRTAALEHKFDDWAEKTVQHPQDPIHTIQIFRPQWSTCPIEVYEEITQLWRDEELRNDSNFSWNREAECWRDDSADTIYAQAYPLIDEYLLGRGIKEIEINYWW